MEEEVAKFAAILKPRPSGRQGIEKCWQRALELQEAFADENLAIGRTCAGRGFTQSLQLTTTPLKVADIFRKQMGGDPRPDLHLGDARRAGQVSPRLC